MKVLAMLTLVPDAQLATVRAELANELRGSWALYASGVLREVYATEDPKRVVFVVEADDTAAARRHLATLPLVTTGLFKIEFLELRPFVNWAMLFAHCLQALADRLLPEGSGDRGKFRYTVRGGRDHRGNDYPRIAAFGLGFPGRLCADAHGQDR